MSWRRLPPVSAPISPSTFLSASAAALGLITPSTEELERKFSTAFAARRTVFTASGTEALILALRAVAPPGTVVAMPGYACIDIIAAAIGAGVRVTLYDVAPETLSPDLDSVRAALRRGARALVAAPLYGYPVDLPGLSTIAAEHGVPLVEDAAQAAGATLHEKPVGSFGDISILSFGRGKGMTAGAGGALLLRNSTVLESAKAGLDSMRPPHRGVTGLAALATQWVLGRPNLYVIPTSIPALHLGEMVYRPPQAPRHISASAAMMLGAARSMNDVEVRARRANAAQLRTAAEESSKSRPVIPLPGADPGYLRFAVRDVSRSLAPNVALGVLRGYPITLDEHEQTRTVLADLPSLLGARELRDSLLTMPTHSLLRAADVTRLRQWMSGARMD